ncbi:MAG: hypothetical protein AABY15_01555, partial [Nanoarchaeota archaeon]
MNYEGKEYREFEDLKVFVHSLNLATPANWISYWEKTDDVPEDIPRNPNIVYQNSGWIGWDDFLGESKRYSYFHECRDTVSRMNFKSFDEWKKYCKSGYKPESIPDNPHIIYSDEWSGWDDFLGIKEGSIISKMSNNKKKNKIKIEKEEKDDSKSEEISFLFFEVARDFVKICKLKDKSDWEKFCKSNNMPKNIPHNPDVYYADKGWVSWEDWLGIENTIKNNRFTLSYEDLKEFALANNIKSSSEWKKIRNRPENIPANPDTIYKNRGWVSWPHFLETTEVKTIDKYLSYKEASEFVIGLGIKTSTEWNIYCKSGNKPKNIPMTPHHVYKNDGWISWPYFLGTREGDFISCKDASDFVIGIGIKTVKEWQNFCKSGNRPKNVPSSPPEY